MTGDTLLHCLYGHAERIPGAPALHGQHQAGVATHWNWADYAADVRAVAAGLVTLGVAVGDRIGIIANNRPEWVIAQYGILAANAVVAPMYATLVAEQAAFILDHGDVSVVFCDSAAQADKLRTAARDRSLTLVNLVDTPVPGTISLEDLKQAGVGNEIEVRQRTASIDPDGLCMLIYTSGTTGEPKGVMLSHANMLAVASGMIARFPSVRNPGHYLSYLPLCHVAEQQMTNYLQLATGGEVTFLDDPARLLDTLKAVQPTVFLGVPRVWEKIEAALRARMSQATGLRKRLATWATNTELRGFDADVARDDGRVQLGLGRRLARRLVISRVWDALGMSRLTTAVTGGAPMSANTTRFFASLGIVVFDGYGMSETSGVATGPHEGRPRFGTVGSALPGVELRIADDGEVMMRGPTVTRGYFDRPQWTAELFDEDGWMHSGDLGQLDDEGNLRITGRKKEIIITSGGKNIAPNEIEDHIKRIPGIDQAIVIGDARPYLVALVTLDVEALDTVAAEAAITVDGPPDEAALMGQSAVHDWALTRIEAEANPRVARVQTVKKVRVVPAFTVDGGELTPKMSLRRKVIHQQFARLIDQMYEAS